MNKTVVIYLKSAGAFLLPLLAALTAGLAPFTATGSPAPSHIAIVIIICTALGAGITGLTSFLSRSYADHQDETDAKTIPSAAPTPATNLTPVIADTPAPGLPAAGGINQIKTP